MKSRPTFTFRVPVEMASGETRWLGPGGTLVDTEPEAVAFTFHRSPTGLERIAIERACHAILGDGSESSEAVGLAAWSDLNRGVEQLAREVYAVIERELWPTGRPPTSENEELQEQERRLSDAFARSTCAEKRRWRTLREQSDRILFMARWNVLGVDLPDFCADLSVTEFDDEGLWTALEMAFFHARQAATVGKPTPSGT